MTNRYYTNQYIVYTCSQCGHVVAQIGNNTMGCSQCYAEYIKDGNGEYCLVLTVKDRNKQIAAKNRILRAENKSLIKQIALKNEELEQRKQTCLNWRDTNYKLQNKISELHKENRQLKLNCADWDRKHSEIRHRHAKFVEETNKEKSLQLSENESLKTENEQLKTTSKAFVNEIKKFKAEINRLKNETRIQSKHDLGDSEVVEKIKDLLNTHTLIS